MCVYGIAKSVASFSDSVHMARSYFDYKMFPTYSDILQKSYSATCLRDTGRSDSTHGTIPTCLFHVRALWTIALSCPSVPTKRRCSSHIPLTSDSNISILRLPIPLALRITIYYFPIACFSLESNAAIIGFPRVHSRRAGNPDADAVVNT